MSLSSSFRSCAFQFYRASGLAMLALCFVHPAVLQANEGGAATGEVEAPAPRINVFESEDGKYRYTVDATQAPDLVEWAEEKMMPVVQAWYPKIVAMLPSENFTPPSEVFLEFRSGIRVPAYASGNRVTMNVEWFRRELEREALGCVVHELVHVVQNYGRARRTNPNPQPTPGWVVEGIADYIRWFLFEPETRGAEITRRNLASARYDGNYRITANFLNWVVEHHNRDLIVKLNAAARAGKYSEDFWIERTGKSVQDLGAAWRQGHEERLSQTN